MYLLVSMDNKVALFYMFQAT